MKKSEEILEVCKEMREWIDAWRDFDMVSGYQAGLDELEDMVNEITDIVNESGGK